MGGSIVEYYFNYIKLSYICLCCIFLMMERCASLTTHGNSLV